MHPKRSILSLCFLWILCFSPSCVMWMDEHHYDDDFYVDSSVDEIETVSIDEDESITANPGEGAGIFVEYASGGAWRIWTTCDTSYSGYACSYSLFITPEDSAAVSFPESDDLENSDAVLVYDSGAIDFYPFTSTDVDSITFKATPGAELMLEVYVDGYSYPELVYWVGDGILHTGAPSNPVIFSPN